MSSRQMFTFPNFYDFKLIFLKKKFLVEIIIRWNLRIFMRIVHDRGEQHAQRGILAWQERSTHFTRCSANGRASYWCFVKYTRHFYLMRDNRSPWSPFSFFPSNESYGLISSSHLQSPFRRCHATLLRQRTILHLRTINFSRSSRVAQFLCFALTFSINFLTERLNDLDKNRLSVSNENFMQNSTWKASFSHT